MSRTRNLTAPVLAAVFTVVACENAVEPEPNMPGPSFSANPVVQSVSGSGSFIAPAGDWRTFSFTARRHADGTVAGQWQRIRRQPGNASQSKSHGIVTCFTIVGTQAFLGGVTTTGLFSTPPNNENAWRVVDNGQGASAPPDQMSLEFVGAPPGFAASYCALTQAAPPLINLQAGNIQVRP